MSEATEIQELVPKEGWHVLHQTYEVDFSLWEEYSLVDRLDALENFRDLCASVQEIENAQLKLYSVIGKASFGFMAIFPDLDDLDAFEKAFTGSLGPGILEKEYSFLSLTEESEYTTTDEEWEDHLEKEEEIQKGSDEMKERMDAFRDRMAKYRHDRVYPQLSNDWETVCFYPMRKRRDPGQNWYALTYEERRELMKGHARVGRTYAGRVKQLITGATGLSDWEWGVTLFSNTIDEFKSIIYEMRFDEVSYQYADFGPFYIGRLLDTDDLLRRLDLTEEDDLEYEEEFEEEESSEE